MTSIKQQKPPVTIAHQQDVQAATKLDRLIDQLQDPESENPILILLLLLWTRKSSLPGCSLFHTTLFFSLQQLELKNPLTSLRVKKIAVYHQRV